VVVEEDHELTLKHDSKRDLTTEVIPDDVDIEEYRIKIRREDNDTWHILSTGQKEEPWGFVIAGNFELKGEAQVEGEWCSSDKETVEVQFPTYNQIVGDDAVQSFTDDTWQKTLDNCTEDPNERQEFGCWVFLDTGENEYEAGEEIPGDTVGPMEAAGISLGSRPDDEPEAPEPDEDGAIYPIASFHTHTPTTYREDYYDPDEGRGVGPSGDDEDADNAAEIPGIVYDYVEAFPDSDWIPMGHPKDADAQRYHSGDFDRRPTP